MSAHVKLSFETVPKMFKGAVPVLFDKEVKRVLLDCVDRDTEEKPRIVTIKFKIAPVKGTHGDEAAIEAEVTSTLPNQVTRLHTVAVRNNGDASFHPDIPDDPKSEALFDGMNETE